MNSDGIFKVLNVYPVSVFIRKGRGCSQIVKKIVESQDTVSVTNSEGSGKLDEFKTGKSPGREAFQGESHGLLTINLQCFMDEDGAREPE